MTASKTGSTPVRWGYTLADLDRMARIATALCHGRAISAREKYEVAWSAIAERISAASDEADATERDLVKEGAHAASAHQWENMRHRGLASDKAKGSGVMPRFPAYWVNVAGTMPSFEDRIIDEVALGQIWSRLSGKHRKVLEALALLDDHDKAAAALGYKRGSYQQALSHARMAFFALWHEGEAPSRLWGRDVRKGGTGLADSLRRRGLRSGTVRRKTWSEPIPREKVLRAIELREEGLSWRAIGAELGTSHVGIRRVVLTETAPPADLEQSA